MKEERLQGIYSMGITFRFTHVFKAFVVSDYEVWNFGTTSKSLIDLDFWVKNSTFTSKSL